MNAIPVTALTKVIQVVKAEIGAYEAWRVGNPVAPLTSGQLVQMSLPAGAAVPALPPAPVVGPGCNHAQGLDLDITQVKLELTTTDIQTAGLNGSVGIPITPIIVTPGAGYTNTTNNTQKLDFTEFLISHQSYTPDPAGTTAGLIARQLINLHAALVAGATTSPCYSPVDPSAPVEPGKPTKPQAQTYEIGFTVTGDLTVNPKISLGTILSVGANYEDKSTSGNTLTVTFSQVGGTPVAK